MEKVAVPLEDLHWLGAFARRLAADTDEADDLVQETLMTAWQSSPEPTGGLRPWLASVLRNRFRMHRRGEGRREAREALHAPTPASSDAPDTAVARLRVLEQLAAEIAKLDPRDQQLIVRRFLEGQSAAEIAAAMSIPAGTVRARISRLLGRLRARLDTRCEGRDAWCAAVLAAPLAGPQGPMTASTKGTSTMIKTTAILTITTLGATTAWLAREQPQGEVTSARAEHPLQTSEEATDATAKSAEPAAPSEAPKAEAQDPEASQARWRETRSRVAAALETHEPTAEPKEHEGTPSAYARLIVGCVRDLEDQPAQFSVMLTEIGAPDIGRIVSEVEVLGTSVDNPEIVECAEQSMYAYVGEPPEEPFERTVRFGMRMPARNEKPEHEGKVFRYNMTKRIDDVRACVPEETRGFVEVEVSLAAGTSAPEAVSVVETDVDEAIGTCIRETVMGWRHFATIQSETHRYRYALPLKPKTD